MGNFIRLYVVTNTRTGESFTGSSPELAEKLRTSRQMIYQYAMSGKTYRGEWVIEPIEHENKEYKGGITVDLCEKWERVTKPFKDAIRARSKS